MTKEASPRVQDVMRCLFILHYMSGWLAVQVSCARCSLRRPPQAENPALQASFSLKFIGKIILLFYNSDI